MLQMKLPKSCIACNHFTVMGYKEDKYCPYVEKYTGRQKSRTQFGECRAHNKKVFCTELCDSFAYDDNYIEVVDVANRPEPLEPHQAELWEVSHAV